MHDKIIKETELFVKNINNKTHKELLEELKKDNKSYNKLLLKTFLMIENKNQVKKIDTPLYKIKSKKLIPPYIKSSQKN